MQKFIDLNPPTKVYLMVLYLKSMLRIRDVYPGSEFFHPGSRVKKIPDPGCRGQKGTGFRIQIHNTAYNDKF
jgi:hypothetical protein